MRNIVVRFGFLAIALMILLQLSKYSWATFDIRSEVFVVIFALIFGTIGILLNRHFGRKRVSQIQEDFQFNDKMLGELGISSREMEVLEALADGRSNKEIADTLYISESTVKTHVSNILLKLDSKRRTEAVKRAKELRLLK